MKKTIHILLAIISLSGCTEEEPSTGGYTHHYFPLHIGNYWEYSPSPDQNFNQLIIKNEIVSTSTFGDYEYALVIQTYSTSYGTLVDSTYYRIDARGFVYSRKNESDTELNRYRLGAEKGEKWVYKTTSSGDGEILVSDVGSVELNDVTIEACKTYSYDVKQTVDEEYYTVLAPGFGVIETGSASFPPATLKKAIIDGQEYNF